MQTLIVEFPDAFPGVQVVLITSPVPVRALLDVETKRRTAFLNDEDFSEVFRLFAPYVQSWTFPDPVGVEGLMALDFSVVAALLDAWVEGVRDVPRPLSQTSSATAPSEAEPAKRSRRR